jgi:cellulose synthase/poly-beta-1,6-N-acetylglucosamine synthase-like glycosyltransferase
MLPELSIIASIGLALLGLGDCYLLVVHRIRRASALHDEKRASERAETLVQKRVCVQLPLYNEPTQATAAIRALCQLDWPKEQLEIQVLDDSDDETTALAYAETALQQSLGCNVRLFHRRVRTGYKAGSLQEGLQATAAEFIAIFDADFRPPASFLRVAITVLQEEPRLAFVQGRLEFRNRPHNWLTRAQGIEQDIHYAYEQAARSWAGLPMMFNGTCGVWRRAAIEEAGGWSARTLGEDQELSWRALALGWRSRLMLTLSASGKMPDAMLTLLQQRSRWNTGAMQAARSLPLSLLRSLRWHQAAAFCLLALFNTTAAFLLSLSLVSLVLAALVGSAGLAVALHVLGGSLLLIVALKTTAAICAVRVLGRPLNASFWRDVAEMWILQALLVPTSAIAAIRGLRLKGGEFNRTPKG